MSADAQYGAVILIGFGGPGGPAEIRPFLDHVTAGRPIPRERYEEVVHHYEAIGGRSPFNEITARQAAALGERLAHAGQQIPVVLGMRNTPPWLEDALRELGRNGVRRALGFVLAAHRCEASWDRYLRNVEEARERIGPAAPAVDYIGGWHAHPLFIEAAADCVAAALARLEPGQRDRAQLIFTAHSIPAAMAAASPYVEQLRESARLVAGRLGRPQGTLAFQSRSGGPRDPWLEPDVCDVLRGLKGQAAVVTPIGFICDHVEVLYDLDIEAARVARQAQVTMVRAATVGEHPRFIEMLAELIGTRLRTRPGDGRERGNG
ncbi:MAG TPA: ferrochelatase [Candidatus Binataceae bacterium]|nr:ferrochelatase [Candidatus Binataceae bacterium]